MSTTQIENILFTPKSSSKKEEAKNEQKALSINYIVVCIAIPLCMIISFGVFLVGILMGPFWLIFVAAGMSVLTIICFVYLHLAKRRITKTRRNIRRYFSGYLPKNVTGYAFIDTCPSETVEEATESGELPTYDEAVVGDEHYKINGILIVYTGKCSIQYKYFGKKLTSSSLWEIFVFYA